MAIEFSCSQCHCELRVRQEDVGKKARCPRCGMIHDVPSTSMATATSPDQATVYQPAPADHGTNAEMWSLKTPDGQVYGPVPRDELLQWADQGRVSGQCLVQLNGEVHWQSALTLFPQLASAPPTAPYQPAQTGTPYSSPAPAQRYVTRLRPNNGVAIFVMGIIGLIFTVIPIFALIALCMGIGERGAISRGEASDENRWMVDVGFAFGLIGSAIGGLLIFGCCVVGPIFG